MNAYETMFIFKTKVEDKAKEKVLTGIRNIISSAKGEVEKMTPWGVRKLAYPVKDEEKGEYYIAQFLSPPNTIKDIAKYLELNEHVLKYMTTKKDSLEEPKDQKVKKEEKKEEAKEA
ncbi:MAG: 30S ribosomal protein S6 [bacterium]|nr:30S ribosomal protein S6 [bacterium]